MGTKSKFIGPVKTVVFGVLCIFIACMIWLNIEKNPFNELALIIRNTQTTTGYLVDTIEHESERSVYEVGVYIYRLPDGSEYKTSKENPLGESKKNEEIEYLSSNPAISRIKGDGCTSVLEWLLRKVGASTLLLVIFLMPGLYLLRDGIQNIKKLRANN